MNPKDIGEDTAFFLYLAPLAASIVYGVYEWLQIGPHSGSMPGNAFLITSKDPYLFLFSLSCILVGLVLEVRTTPFSSRAEIVSANVRRMQILAIVVLVVSFAASDSAAGYGDVVTAVSFFLAARYALIFALFLLGMSILFSLRQFVGGFGYSALVEFIGLLLIGASPLVLYVGLKIHLDFSASGAAAIIALILGLVLFFTKGKRFSRAKQVRPAEVKTP